MLILYNGCYQEVSKEQITYMENKGVRFDILDENLHIVKKVNDTAKGEQLYGKA